MFFSLLVYGALLGRQKGRNIELCTSFEIKMKPSEDKSLGDEDIDLEFLNTQIGQCKILKFIWTQNLNIYTLHLNSSQTSICGLWFPGLVHIKRRWKRQQFGQRTRHLPAQTNMQHKREPAASQTRPIRETHRFARVNIRVGHWLHRPVKHTIYRTRVLAGHRWSRTNRRGPHRQTLQWLLVV